MDVSIIIVNYNTKVLTLQCIDSIFAQTSGIDFEVILVDNGSVDGSRELFTSDNRITYIYSHENLGFGKANNLGVTYAKGQYLFFLNSDTYLLNNAIQQFYAFCKASPVKLGFVGTCLLDKDGGINGYGDEFPSIWKSLKRAMHLTNKQHSPHYNDLRFFEVEYVLGADMFVANSVFSEVGGFDESFFMYYEESDLQYRTHIKGYKNVIIDGPQIVHLEGKSTQHITQKKRMMVEKSHLCYHRKHTSAILFRVFLLVYMLLKLPVFLNRHFTWAENCDYFNLLVKAIR